MHYRIKLVGDYQVPERPWLNITMAGYSFESESYAHKFATIAQVGEWIERLKDQGEKVYATWHDESPKPKRGAWGEVNPKVFEKKG
ncbi:MAG: hypothetical protein CL885_04625 [Dehalococcoidia bacterium]|nr:hypothetical protein [Dehalococcoidia bacterium]